MFGDVHRTLLANDDGQARGANLYLVNFFR